jgi:hypothetical protein
MSVLMATEKIRLVLMVADEVRAGLRLEAAKQDVEMSELAESILREALADSIKEVKKRRKPKDESGE